MANELRGAEVRLERAHEHIHALRHESRMFMMELPEAYGWAIDDEPVGLDYIVRAKILRPPPPRLAILAADACHSIRSALDMVAWELALKGDNPPPEDDRSTGFPICTHDGAWKSRSTDRAIERIRPEAVEVINSFQPYHGPPWHRLALVQAIDNWSKHHAIPALMGFHISRGRLLSPGWEFVSFNQEGAYEHGDEICRVRRTGHTDPQERFRSIMKVHVGFSKHGPGRGYPIDFLESAYESIRDQVLPAFAPFFPD